MDAFSWRLEECSLSAVVRRRSGPGFYAVCTGAGAADELCGLRVLKPASKNSKEPVLLVLPYIPSADHYRVIADHAGHTALAAAPARTAPVPPPAPLPTPATSKQQRQSNKLSYKQALIEALTASASATSHPTALAPSPQPTTTDVMAALRVAMQEIASLKQQRHSVTSPPLPPHTPPPPATPTTAPPVSSVVVWDAAEGVWIARIQK